MHVVIQLRQLLFLTYVTFVGYTRQPPNRHNTPNKRSSCALCSCSQRSRECYPENGTCYNCRTGSEGDHCERCQPGVDNTTDCTRCIPGFFGLTPSSGGCRGKENWWYYNIKKTLELFLIIPHINLYCLNYMFQFSSVALFGGWLFIT